MPATIRPLVGSTTSPTALTATSAATTRPFGHTRAIDPTPPFMERPPDILPTVAPAPAPTLPSATGPFVAAVAARYPQSTVGLIFASPPKPRSNRIAAGTIG